MSRYLKKINILILYSDNKHDKYVAQKLRSRLLKYHVPLSIERKFIFKSVKMTDDKDYFISLSKIPEADWIVCVCSPEFKHSPVCNKLLGEFINMRGINKVCLSLASGEPDEAFPDSVIYRDVKTVMPSGEIITEQKKIEPLAANARGNSHRSIKKSIRTDYIKIFAVILNVRYDDLKKRHREHRRARRKRYALMIFALYILFISVTLSLYAVQAKYENENDEIRMQCSVELAEYASALYESGQTREALEYAYMAAGGDKELDVICSDEAEKLLYDILDPYGENIEYVDLSMDSYVWNGWFSEWTNDRNIYEEKTNHIVCPEMINEHVFLASHPIYYYTYPNGTMRIYKKKYSSLGIGNTKWVEADCIYLPQEFTEPVYSYAGFDSGRRDYISGYDYGLIIGYNGKVVCCTDPMVAMHTDEETGKDYILFVDAEQNLYFSPVYLKGDLLEMLEERLSENN